MHHWLWEVWTPLEESPGWAMAHQFMHVKQTVELKKISPRMHQNSPFWGQKSENFLGRGSAPILAPTTPHSCTPCSLAIYQSKKSFPRPCAWMSDCQLDLKLSRFYGIHALMLLYW